MACYLKNIYVFNTWIVRTLTRKKSFHMYAVASLTWFVRALNMQEVCNIWSLEMQECTSWKIANAPNQSFLWEWVYLHTHWPYKLLFSFLTVEILDDDRIQILQSFTAAEAEVSSFFLFIGTNLSDRSFIFSYLIFFSFRVMFLKRWC